MLKRVPLYEVRSYFRSEETNTDGTKEFRPQVHHQIANTVSRITNLNVKSLQILEEHGQVYFIVAEFHGLKKAVTQLHRQSVEALVKDSMKEVIEQYRASGNQLGRQQALPSGMRDVFEDRDWLDVDPVMPVIGIPVSARFDHELRLFYHAIINWEANWTVAQHMKWSTKVWDLYGVLQRVLHQWNREMQILSPHELQAFDHYAQMAITNPQMITIDDEEEGNELWTLK